MPWKFLEFESWSLKSQNIFLLSSKSNKNKLFVTKKIMWQRFKTKTASICLQNKSSERSVIGRFSLSELSQFEFSLGVTSTDGFIIIINQRPSRCGLLHVFLKHVVRFLIIYFFVSWFDPRSKQIFKQKHLQGGFLTATLLRTWNVVKNKVCLYQQGWP